MKLALYIKGSEKINRSIILFIIVTSWLLWSLPTQGASNYTGIYSGTFSGSMSGKFICEVDDYGSCTFIAWSNSKEAGGGHGSVFSNGSVSGYIDDFDFQGGVTPDGRLEGPAHSSMYGTITLSATKCDDGSIKTYNGIYSGTYSGFDSGFWDFILESGIAFGTVYSEYYGTTDLIGYVSDTGRLFLWTDDDQFGYGTINSSGKCSGSLYDWDSERNGSFSGQKTGDIFDEPDNEQQGEAGFDYEAYLAANPDLPSSWGKEECLNHYINYGFYENRAVVFDLAQYLAANPDLPITWSYAEALNHYNMYGKFENRILAFSAEEYLALYGDLPDNWTYIEALTHYILFGAAEGRIPSFDEAAYLEMYSDLPQTWSQAEAFYHYVYYGQYEGRVYDPYDESIF